MSPFDVFCVIYSFFHLMRRKIVIVRHCKYGQKTINYIF